MCTAVQNIGLTISPLLAALCLNTEKDGGYFWLMIYFCALSLIGLCINIWLYVDDIKYRGGILDKVDNGNSAEAEDEKLKVGDFMTSPT